MKKQKPEPSLRITLMALIIAAITIAAFFFPARPTADLQKEKKIQLVQQVDAAEIETPTTSVFALVTGYNTVPEQTDNTPCIAASGDDICGRDDVVACPREYPLGTKVGIDGKTYECLDRTARKFDGRWDISCDKDFQCPYEVHGHKEVQILSVIN